MPITAYFTIRESVCVQLDVKRSVFVCDLRPVSSEQQARDVISEVRSVHHDARHHCSAFVVGPDALVRRSHDDGEPSGTAGAPMLEVLAGAADGVGLTNVVAVVTRWFGGIKLGTGGLARAYGDSVRQAVAEAQVVQYELRELFTTTVPHALAAKLEHGLRHRQIAVINAEYRHDAVVFTVGSAPDRIEEISVVVNSLVGGHQLLSPAGSQWVC